MELFFFFFFLEVVDVVLASKLSTCQRLLSES